MEGRRFLSAFMLLTLLFMSMAATQWKPASAAASVPSPWDEEDNIPWSEAGEDFLPLAAGVPAGPTSPPADPGEDAPSPPEQDPPPTTPTPTTPTGPSRRCKARSHRFRGMCVSRSNCAHVCRTEGFTGGFCGGILIPACWCTKPCFFEEELPLSANPSAIDNFM